MFENEGDVTTNHQGSYHFRLNAGVAELIDCKLHIHRDDTTASPPIDVDVHFPQLTQAQTTDLVDAAKVSESAFETEVGNMPQGWQDAWDNVDSRVQPDVWEFFKAATRPA